MFNEQYYKDIWGTVHRHDYCNDLADQLISHYGKCRILDIGTGCGYLVKILREKGCDAWGLEISDYAIQNSCDSEHVRKGDVRDIPFASDRFDLIFSQGLWGYFPKEDIQKAWDECKRVGKEQLHHIDYLDYEQTHKYLFTENAEFWKNQFYPKVLVACPNHVDKEYSFQRWIDNVKNLTYPNYDILVVDNSPDITFMERYKAQIPILHITVNQELRMLAITRSMELIRQHFLSDNYAYWMNIESDVIPPKDIIEQLMKYKGDWISHAYPTRGNNTDDQQGIGCSLLSRRLVEDFDWNEAEDNSPDGWLWQKVKPVRKYKTVEVWGEMQVEHLAN